ncbi:MAG: protein translocase subunit SecF [Deltaproteobacteria bacterium]|nr:protein translocase subunit SecF [Deltaproteobacteria bacterium]
MTGERKGFDFDWIGRMWLFIIMSTVLVAGSVALVATRGLNFGIDFAGGYEIQVKFPETVSETQIREVLEPLNVDFGVQRYGKPEDNTHLILVRKHGTVTKEGRAAIEADFQALAGGAEGLSTWSMAESGENITAGFLAPVDEAKVRGLLDKHGLTIKKLSRSEREDQPEYSIQLVSLAGKIESALRAGFKIAADWPLVPRVEFVGPQVGEQLRNQGFMAVLYSFFFILLYVAVRFDLFFAPGAVIALVHDVTITVGVFAFTGLEFNLTVVAGLLTLVGYSINDTIVVYDRIRENVVRLRGRDLRGMVNTSMNETMSRTILTSFLTLLVVAALFIFGGEVIKPFAVSLLVGITIGTYSSIYIASPIYILLKERFHKGATAADVATAT